MTVFATTIVLDTNVYVAALLSKTGASAALLDLWLNEARFDVVVSPKLLEELDDVLSRPKFQKINEHLKTLFLASVQRLAIHLPDSDVVYTELRDSNDNFVLALALQSKVTALVSLDLDVLELKVVNNLPILTPGVFLQQLRTVEPKDV
jgi:uncharacterized protein